ncbi:hypothetical protein T492DRAFT_914016 [Pavlovales sp. CCMP2436]|nr:hypothetical protein T492DRAFT_914016 [Pavlovales sp. CCMP2436]
MRTRGTRTHALAHDHTVEHRVDYHDQPSRPQRSSANPTAFDPPGRPKPRRSRPEALASLKAGAGWLVDSDRQDYPLLFLYMLAAVFVAALCYVPNGRGPQTARVVTTRAVAPVTRAAPIALVEVPLAEVLFSAVVAAGGFAMFGGPGSGVSALADSESALLKATSASAALSAASPVAQRVQRLAAVSTASPELKRSVARLIAAVEKVFATHSIS